MRSPWYQLLAERPPDALVAIGGAGERRVSDLMDDVAAMAGALPVASAGSEILLLSADRYDFIVGLLAAWQAGHAVALPPNGQPETLRELAARPTVVHTVRDGVSPRAKGVARPLRFEGGRHLATLYTSGTTGGQRACPKTAAQILGEAALLAQLFGVREGDRVLATVPPNHIYGLLVSALVPLSTGAVLVRSTPLYAETVVAEARTHGATILVSVPAHLRGLSLAPQELPSLRLVFSSGAPLDPATAHRLSAIPGGYEILGSSETGGFASRRMGESAWRPFPGTQVSCGPNGGLLLASPFLEEGSAQPRPCADRIELLAGGTFRHLGRLDDVVKIAGKRVALSELEQALRLVPGVDDAAVLATDSNSLRGAEILAVVAGTGPTAADLRQALLQSFDPTVLPRRIKVVDALPHAENGKLSRARLLALFAHDERRRELPVTRLTSERSASRDTLAFEVQVPKDLSWLEGHFEDFPLLPGVVQLGVLVMGQCRLAWPDLGGLRRLSRVKFRKPIRGGDAVVLRIDRALPGHSVTYSIERAGQPCSSGTLDFAAGQP